MQIPGYTQYQQTVTPFTFYFYVAFIFDNNLIFIARGLGQLCINLFEVNRKFGYTFS